MSQRVVVVPSDKTGCGQYRMYWPAEAVRRLTDWRIDIVDPDVGAISTGPDGKLNATRGFDLHGADVLVVQRIGSPGLVSMMAHAKSMGMKIVVEVDDDLAMIDPRNAAKRYWTAEQLKWFKAAFSLADTVTATTEALLAKYAKRSEAIWLPNCVPSAVLDLNRLQGSQIGAQAFSAGEEKPLEPFPAGPILGWSGHVLTHPGDLAEARPAISYARARGWTIAGMADRDNIAREWGLEPHQVVDIQAATLGAPYYAQMSRFDVGLVPLADTAFNRAKSWLKVLEFSAMGVCVIASDTPEHLAAVKDRGLLVHLASNATSWQAGVDNFAHPEVRHEIAEMNRKVISRDWTFEARAEEWVKAWKR